MTQADVLDLLGEAIEPPERADHDGCHDERGCPVEEEAPVPGVLLAQDSGVDYEARAEHRNEGDRGVLGRERADRRGDEQAKYAGPEVLRELPREIGRR